MDPALAASTRKLWPDNIQVMVSCDTARKKMRMNNEWQAFVRWLCEG
jgi:hypothetical protein